MNDKKICFILCVNNEIFTNECLLYLQRLFVPEGYDTDVLTIEEAESMCSGYNEGMKASDAKYKIYLHQDTFIVDRYFLYEMLDIFKSDEKIGMIGAVGAPTMPKSGCMWDGDRVWSVYAKGLSNSDGCNRMYSPDQYRIANVEAIDGLLMVTQYDIEWREDIFTDFDFYDASQSMEFITQGFKVVVPVMDKPICVHDDGVILSMINYEKNRKIFLEEYSSVIQGDF